MRKNPLATAIRAIVSPEFATFCDPLHPGLLLVARRGADGHPDAKRIVAAIEQRETLDTLNPIFRDPPAGLDQWRTDWDNSTLTLLADTGGRVGKYYCARIELPPGEVPKNLGQEAP